MRRVAMDGAENSLAAAYCRNSTQHLVRAGSFEQIATCSGTHGGEDGVVVLVHGDDENTDMWAGMQDAARGLDTAHAGHLQVHQDYVWLQRRGQNNCFFSCGRLANYLGLWVCPQKGTHAAA